jgi:hypothetical protein
MLRRLGFSVLVAIIVWSALELIGFIGPPLSASALVRGAIIVGAGVVAYMAHRAWVTT